MPDDPRDRAVGRILAGLIVGLPVVVGMIVLAYRRIGGAALSRPEKSLVVPWGPFQAIAAVLLQIGLSNVVGGMILGSGGKQATLRETLLAHSVASAGALAVVLAVIRARAVDLGLSFRRLPRDILRGAAGAALAIPVVFGVQYYAAKVWTPERHPADLAVKADASALTPLVVALGAVVVAPIVEEVVCRGILLGWLRKATPSPSWVSDLRANAVVSFLFAGLHLAQWPAPIPLFVLSMGLGELYRRSGGVVAPIVMHSLFNSVSTAALLLSRA